MYGNDGFRGLALLDPEEYVNEISKEKETPSDNEFDDNEDTWIDLNNENDVSKRGGDFIRLSRSQISPPLSGHDYLARIGKRSISRILRGAKRSPLGEVKGGKGNSGAFIRLSRAPNDGHLTKMYKRAAMWKFRAGKRAYPTYSGDTWYYFRA